MSSAIISKIENLEIISFITFMERYENDTHEGKYNFHGDLFPCHLSDALFLYDNAYHHTHYDENTNETKRKLHKIVGSEDFFIAFVPLYFMATGIFFPLYIAMQAADYARSFIPESAIWSETATNTLGIIISVILLVLSIILFVLGKKEKDLSSLTIFNKEKTERLKNISMVAVEKDMPEKISIIHTQFCSTMEDIFKNDPQALSNAGWDLLISSYEDYTSLYVFLAERNGIISSELMDKYATKLEKRYQEFSSMAQDVIDTSLTYQLYLFEQEKESALLEQDMLDSEVLRVIPLKEEKEI